jgi:hypothetical protein
LFASSWTLIPNATHPFVALPLANHFTFSSLTPAAKLSWFPIKKNVILLRVENIADNFDLNDNSTNFTFYFNVKQHAIDLYAYVNRNSSLPLSGINIVEMALSAN